MARILAFLTALLLAVPAFAAPPGTVTPYGTICDWRSPSHCVTVDSSGNLGITGSISASSSEHSTAAAPSYVEGTDNPLSGDLSGNLRTITGSGSTTVVTGNVTVVQPTGTNLHTVTDATSTNASIGTTGAAVKTSTTLAGVSDGTNQQPIIAPIALGDGVNGNNSVSVGGFVWNGASWDRMPGGTTGVAVKQATASNLNATVVGTGTFATQSAITAASGSIASGAVSSGAYASGSLASGAVVDITNLSTPVTAGAATATKAIALGCRNQTAPDTAADTNQMAVGCDTRTNLKTTLYSANSATAIIASAPADTVTTPTAGQVLSTRPFPEIYNGSSHDLQRSIANGTNSTGTGITAAGVLAQCDDTSPTAITENSFGNVRFDCATHALKVNLEPVAATGGLTFYFLQPTASDNHANIKNGAGNVYGISVTNNSATINYLRLYNAASGFNGCNSATNLQGQWAIPASTSGAGIVIPLGPYGMAFATGISICVTSGYATTDTTNATASAMSVNIQYK